MWVYVCGSVTAYNAQQTLAFKLKNNQKKRKKEKKKKMFEEPLNY